MCLITVATVGMSYVAWAFGVVDRTGPAMLVAGRRGDLANWPENTLEGVISAAEAGADAVEVDVRQSADGTYYLMHDATVDRTTDGYGHVGSLTDQEIDNLVVDGGLGFNEHQNLKVPALKVVLDALRESDILILLDAKGNADEHEALARYVIAQGLTNRVWICTYAAGETAAVRGVAPITTYGGDHTNADLLMAPSPLGPFAALSPPAVTAIREDWHGSEARSAQLAWRWGVRVYITNDLPQTLLEVSGRGG